MFCIVLMLLSTKIMAQDKQFANRHWIIDSAIDQQNHILKLYNLQNDTVYEVSIANLTIGDFNLLRKIDFKLSSNPDRDCDTLRLQLLFNGVAWLSSLSRATKDDFDAFKYAVLNKQGIWQPGFLYNNASQSTWRILTNDLKRNNLLSQDTLVNSSYTSNDNQNILIANLRSTISAMQIEGRLKQDNAEENLASLRVANQKDSLRSERKVKFFQGEFVLSQAQIRSRDSIIRARDEEIHRKSQGDILIMEAGAIATVAIALLTIVTYFEKRKKRKEQEILNSEKKVKKAKAKVVQMPTPAQSPIFRPTTSKPEKQPQIPFKIRAIKDFEKKSNPASSTRSEDGKYSIKFKNAQ